MRERAQHLSRAFWCAGPGRGEIREQPLAEPAPGHVLVETRYSGVSRGSEALVFEGRVPPSEYARMAAPHQQGSFPFPVSYGYACVGDVVAGEPELIGRTVFCLHPHHDRFVVPAEAVVPVPDEVPAGRAVLAANFETALNGFWDGGPGPCDRIAIVGGGVVGLLVGSLAASMPGSQAVLVDVSPDRRKPAGALGLAFAAPDEAPPDCDIVFHASGSDEGLATALRCAGPEATVVELSWYGDRQVSAALGEAFHARRLTLKSSQVGHLPPARAPRWSRTRRLGAALALLADDRYDTLISGESRFDELPDAMPRLVEGGGSVLCHRIRYTTGER